MLKTAKGYPLTSLAIICLAIVGYQVLSYSEPEIAVANPIVMSRPVLVKEEGIEFLPALPAEPTSLEILRVMAPGWHLKAPAAVPEPPKPKTALQVPRWIVKGILAKESSSKLTADNDIRWVNRKRGLAGERGCTQITKVKFNEVKLKGEYFAMLEEDPHFAVEVTQRIILDHYKKYRSWDTAVAMYNPNNGEYLYLVKKLGRSSAS
jgi:hypothetical protein